MDDIVALMRDRDARGGGRTDAQAAALQRAQAEAAEARVAAATATARVGELEARLAAAEMAALDLRSRLVCLSGKLATTSATVRYQSMTLALEGRLDGAPEPAEARPH